MSSGENEKLARRYIDEVINDGKLELVDEIYAEDYVNHTASQSNDDSDTASLNGRDGVRDVVSQWRMAFPDVHATIDDIFESGDRVAYRATVRGTHDGDWGGVTATGRPIHIRILSIMRIENGRIAERWENADNLSLLDQLGVS